MAEFPSLNNPSFTGFRTYYLTDFMVSFLKDSFQILFLGIILLFISVVANGQSLQDIQNVKVDNLSDAQIEQLIKRAESSGLNEQQLESMARERGMPATEVAKLRQRIMGLRSGGRAAAPARSEERRVGKEGKA